MKKLIRGIFVLFLLVLIVLAFFTVRGYLDEKSAQSRLLTFDSDEEDKRYEESLKLQPSDIRGMSKYDKSKKGLQIEDGSDTDYDGLTDKQEIEKYKSNPLKESTAGDLYTDGYKVKHGMDLFKKYKYEGSLDLKYNECEDVKAIPKVPHDLNGIIENHTGYERLSGCTVYREYYFYNFTGEMSIDLSLLLEQNNLTLDDIKVIFVDGKVRKCKYSANGNVITIKNKHDDNFCPYRIYIVNKDAKIKTDGSVDSCFAIEYDNFSSQGHGFIAGFPIISDIIGKPAVVYYEDLGNDDKSLLLRDKVLNYANNNIFGWNLLSLTDKGIEKKSSIEIERTYNLYTKLFPEFEFPKKIEDIRWWNFIFTYYYYQGNEEDTVKNDAKDEPEIFSSGFNIEKDELPFPNFHSYISTGGNCAGISHLTVKLFNTGGIDKHNISVITREGLPKVVKWDITKNEENTTLLDNGLSDYQDFSFTAKYGDTNKTYMDEKNLKNHPAQYEFIKMVGDYWDKENENYNLSKNKKKKESNPYNYSIILRMEEKINNKEIVDICLNMPDNKLHSVVAYAYYHDKEEPEVVWFKIYDSNLPCDKFNGKLVNEKGCLLKVTMCKNLLSGGNTFYYEYRPIKNYDAYKSTNKQLSKDEQYCFVVLGENYHQLQ